jgi:hypothetical protein
VVGYWVYLRMSGTLFSPETAQVRPRICQPLINHKWPMAAEMGSYGMQILPKILEA